MLWLMDGATITSWLGLVLCPSPIGRSLVPAISERRQKELRHREQLFGIGRKAFEFLDQRSEARRKWLNQDPVVLFL